MFIITIRRRVCKAKVPESGSDFSAFSVSVFKKTSFFKKYFCKVRQNSVIFDREDGRIHVKMLANLPFVV